MRAQRQSPFLSQSTRRSASASEQALIEFYQALGGPDWIERDFWL